MRSEWKLSRPGILIRVAGDIPAQSTAADRVQHVAQQKAQQVAAEGVVHAASKTSAFVLSTGLDFGVTSFVRLTATAAGLPLCCR